MSKRSARLLAAVALVVTVTALAAVPTVGAASETTPGRPLAVAAQSTGNVQVFWTSAAGQLVEAAETNGSWGAAADTPVSGLTSDPAVVNIGTTDYVFYAGPDENLWEVIDSAGSWGTPQDLDTGALTSDPTVAEWSPSANTDELDVFWGAPGGAIYEDFEDAPPQGAWSGAIIPEPYTNPSSAPAVSGYNNASGAGVNMFWEQAPTSLDQGFYQQGTGWSNVLGITSSDVTGPPTVGQIPSGYVDVFWQGSNSDLWLTHWNLSTWSSPADQGISVGSAPTALAISDTEEDVFWEAGGDLWEAVDSDGSFTAVQSQASLTPQPATQTTPQSVSISAAPVTAAPSNAHGTVKKARPRVHVKVTLRATWDLDRTRIRALTFSRIPAHSGVRISCTGRRCPRNLGVTSSKLRLATLVRRLESDTFVVGQKIVIRIGHSGDTPQTVALTIRRGAAPAAKLL